MFEPLFIEDALHLFRKQSMENPLYKIFIEGLHLDPSSVCRLQDIPFLPISFFKTHLVKSGEFSPELCFESSGTTGMINSKHCIRDVKQYLDNAVNLFEEQYGDLRDYCILGLLPSYLERNNSSLVSMVNHFIQLSHHPSSGFFLHDFNRLQEVLMQLEESRQKTLLIGVTFALLDFAASHPMQLHHTIVMETGGMKGRRKELTRSELHQHLRNGFGVDAIHAEYGMTELLSQCYSKGGGVYQMSSTLKILLRSSDDPFDIWSANEHIMRTGVINVIDLANRDSIAFIATDDLARFTGNGAFELMGRIDSSDVRGCSLLTA
ncbi:MAG: acyl transferase [Bacteroidota bacterium]